MKRTLLPLFLLCILFSCKKHSSPASVTPGQWTALTTPTVRFATGLAGFSFGNNLYVGLGMGTDGSTSTGFWTYDPVNNWGAIRNFPQSASVADAVGFSIDGVGYIVMTPSAEGDVGTLYAYDTAARSWSQKAIYPGAIVQGATAFVIDGKAYVGLGGHAGLSYNQLSQYDPATDTWTTRQQYPDVHTAYAASFVVGGYAYVGTGSSGTEASDVTADFYRYDPGSDSWTKKANFAGGARRQAVGFSVGGKGFISTGTTSLGQSAADCWQYDPGSDSWAKKADFPGGARTGALSWSGTNQGYMGLGTGDMGPVFDLWSFQP